MLSPTATLILAWCVLAFIGLGLAACAVRWVRRTEFTASQAALMALDWMIARILWRASIHGRLPVARGQGAVVVCNHRCSLDPAFIALTVDRMVYWMVAREYVSHPLISWFFRIWRVIPVGRGGVDTAATKAAIRLAQQGELVGIFPEGGINDTSRLLLPGRSGAVLIALKARVPIIPCFVEGSVYDGTVWGCLFTPAKVRFVVGRPIDLSAYYDRYREREVLQELTRRILREIAALAGQPEYPVELAGQLGKRLSPVA
jgi:1-acyl-sn-glycerol-3-phosphate acyltransferase